MITYTYEIPTEVNAEIVLTITDTDGFDTTLRFDYMLTYEPDASNPGDPRLDVAYVAK